MNNITDNTITIDNNEILFWKVINNKFLFKKIFHFIETVEWVKYTKIDSIYESFRSKFKHICNFQWMLQHELYQMSRMKLSNENEYVVIEVEDLKSLLSLNIKGSSGSIEDIKEKINDTLSFFSKPKSAEIDFELFKDILQLSIKRIKQHPSLSIELKKEDLISSSLRNSNLQVINLLFQCLYEDGTTLESTIIKFYNKEVKVKKEEINLNFIFDMVLINKVHKNTILEYILDIITPFEKQNKYNIGSASNGSDNKNPKKKLKSSNGNSVVTIKSNKPDKLSLSDIMGIKNTIIQNKLLDLDLIEINSESANLLSNYIVEPLNNNKEEIKNGNHDRFIDLLLICFRIIGKPEISKQNYSFKELFKQFIILSKSEKLFYIYMEIYNQVITEASDIKNFKLNLFYYSLDNFIPEIFNTIDTDFISNAIEKEIEYKLKVKPFVSSNLSRSIEFLKLYLSKISIVTNNHEDINEATLKTLVDIIYDIVFEITDPIQYEQFVNNEIPECYQVLLPLKWNQIINQFNSSDGKSSIVIKDKETIDWMKQWYDSRLEDEEIDFFNEPYKKFDEIITSLLNFETIELSEYASSQLSSFFESFDYDVNFYQFQFVRAIEFFDIKTIKKIHSLGFTFQDYDMVIDNKDTLFATISYEDINQTFNYLIEKEMISEFTLYKLIGNIVNCGYYNDSIFNSNTDNSTKNSVQFDLDKIKIKLINQDKTFKELQKTCENYNHFRFLLSNIKFTNQISQIEINGHLYIANKDEDKSILAIPLIELIINKIKQCREINGSNLKVYYSLVQSIFNELTNNNNELKLEEIKQIYQLFIENQIPLELGNQIKMGYIKCRSQFLHSYLKYISILSKTKQLPSFKLFTHSFDELLEILIDRPYKSKTNNIEDNIGGTNNKYYMAHNLMFFMSINRTDLFLNEWEFIKNEIGITFIPDDKLIRLCCNNLNQDSIINIINEIANTIISNPKNIEQLFEFCIVSLKSGDLNLFKLSLNILSKYLNNKQTKLKELIKSINTTNNDNDHYILKNIYEIIYNLNISKTKINPKKK